MDQLLEIKSLLCEGLAELGLTFGEPVIDRLVDYFDLLIRKNEVLNLISPRQDIRTRVAVHLVDSLTPLFWDKWPGELQALDIGSGGGLPAVPLALVFPGWKYTLAEATAKKAVFLAEVKEALGLDRLTIRNRHLEPNKNMEGVVYDLVTARAVSELKKLAPLAAPRVARGGYFLAFKGPQGSRELTEADKELRRQKLHLVDQIDFVLPLVEARRSLFLFEKG
jgi:16S rRNA (guanine527-N7)-methyltransferase